MEAFYADLFENAKKVLKKYWRGPIWINTN
jgi:hypothetical protein